MEGSFIIESIKTICVLIFVIVLMILTLRGLSKYQNKLSGNKNIKVLERTSLSQNTTLSIIKVGEVAFLVSATPHEVKILKELKDGEINMDAYKTLSIENVKMDSFIKGTEDYLKKFKGKGKDEKKTS
ncbi:MAG: flagellar biosynthetic protein FliO [Clostridium sp.]